MITHSKCEILNLLSQNLAVSIKGFNFANINDDGLKAA